MNGVIQFVLSGAVVVAAAQFIAGPIADWNARREGVQELRRLAQKKSEQDA
ncbi:unnamed protein product [Albugo candida]|uniref:Uncharacterized protein n=1 Tax=Albugo candida TaxID=65357 RepID=A0A024G0N1_9STRA|nr:unnamed protein product [Albugo candida]|eukprot:CCI40124.1 unnamed protein product [Albugo candida]